ncbi:MAG: hypothetical protein ACJAZ1_003421, partial [Yoonia sp.]
DAGISAKHVLPASSPAVGTKMILEQIQPGDLALLLVLSEREAVFKALEKGPSVKVSLRTPIPTRL